MNNLHASLYKISSLPLLLGAPALARAEDINSVQALPAVIGSDEILNMGTSLILIVAVIFVVAWLYKKIQGTSHNNGGHIRVLAAQPLGPKERVIVVEIAGQQLVLGVTANQIQMLHVLQQALDTDSSSLQSGFAERLRTIIKGTGK